jgi:hypothetical protein
MFTQNLKQLISYYRSWQEIAKSGNTLLVSSKHVSRTSGDDYTALEALVDARLPHVEMPDLLMEVAGWTGFSRHLEHAGGSQARTADLLVYCLASILAQACDVG